jgi:hypothetical protein
MKKEKNIEVELSENLKADFESLALETDEAILEQINRRNDENQALKKLLENLKTSLPKQEIKSSKS